MFTFDWFNSHIEFCSLFLTAEVIHILNRFLKKRKTKSVNGNIQKYVYKPIRAGVRLGVVAPGVAISCLLANCSSRCAAFNLRSSISS